jgi:hypothetical protein
MASFTTPAYVDVQIGSYPVQAISCTAKAATAIAQYEVLQYTLSADTVEPLTTGVAIGIAMHAVASTATDISVQVWVSGEFNHDALIWPAALPTLIKRRKAFACTPVMISKAV